MATPSCRNGTAFWMTMVGTENVGPTPMPARNIQNHTTSIGVSWVSPVMRNTAMPITTIEPTMRNL